MTFLIGSISCRHTKSSCENKTLNTNVSMVFCMYTKWFYVKTIYKVVLYKDHLQSGSI